MRKTSRSAPRTSTARSPPTRRSPMSPSCIARRAPASSTRRTPFDAVIAASGKCLEGVPGMGFVLARRAALERCEGVSASLAMDLYDQWVYMNKTTQWRFTPPTHVVAALDAALAQYLDEGGLTARGGAYAKNCRQLIDGMTALGLRPFLPPSLQAPIIVTFHAPIDPLYDFKTFYNAVKDRGYILYPGKLTTVETFRVGCMGQQIGRAHV